MSELKVDKITPRQGTTLTLGDSGDTINFGSGVLPNFENLTVTGDLTVDTNSLKVDSTNNFVGIGTASPTVALDVVGTANIGSELNVAGTSALRVNTSRVSIDVSGSAATPSLVFNGDTNTGLFRVSSDTIGISTAGTERMRINSSGNVGIGTSSPSRLLELSSSGPIFRITDTTNNAYGEILVNDLGSITLRADEGNSQGNSIIQFDVDGSEAMRIDSDGNILIGATSTASSNYGAKFLKDSTASEILAIHRQATDGDFIQFTRGGNDSGNIKHSGGNLVINAVNDFEIQTNDGTDVVHVGSNGNVGIGTSSPTQKLHLATSSSGSLTLRLENTSTPGESTVSLLGKNSSGTVRSFVMKYDNADRFRLSTPNALPIAFETNDAERMRITGGNGSVGIGTTNPSSLLDVMNNARITSGANTNHALRLEARDAFANDTQSSFIFISSGAVGSEPLFSGAGAHLVLEGRKSASRHIYYKVGDTTTAQHVMLANGNVGINTLSPSDKLAVNGSLSKSSGSFKIDHPLSEKTNTHNLVHSFVEAPQADNIYRGKVDLVNGTATVNIDTVAGMSEGTFVLLNREIQCFTSNETGWTAVKGSVSGNILTITAQDETCTDTISWLMIGERQDQHMYDTEWTDENGKVIVEPLKPVQEEALENA
tara:strand:- start:9252 stop:11219 length:1968 start_codon:yes stop_codon:yes gene_type:complete